MSATKLCPSRILAWKGAEKQIFCFLVGSAMESHLGNTSRQQQFPVWTHQTFCPRFRVDTDKSLLFTLNCVRKIARNGYTIFHFPSDGDTMYHSAFNRLNASGLRPESCPQTNRNHLAFLAIITSNFEQSIGMLDQNWHMPLNAIAFISILLASITFRFDEHTAHGETLRWPHEYRFVRHVLPGINKLEQWIRAHHSNLTSTNGREANERQYS